MSILPFISFFLITIAGFFIAMQNQSQAGCYRSILLFGTFQAERTARNRLQSCLFESIYKMYNDSPKTTRTRESRETRFYPRNFRRISEKHKLNIYELLRNPNPENTDLYDFALQLMHALYRHCDFYTERFPRAMLHCLLESGKRAIQPDNQLHILQIIPAISTQLDEYVIYQTIRGTNYYDVEKREGIPSLFDFFTISSDSKHRPLYFPLLRKIYLKVAFGERCAEAIIRAEEEKKERNKILEKKSAPYVLIKAELFDLLKRVPKETSLYMDEIMAYSRPTIGKSDKKQVEGVDKNTNIHIRKNF